MKDRASFTLDRETTEILDSLMEIEKYRNKSHIVEIAIRLLNDIELSERKTKEKDE